MARPYAALLLVALATPLLGGCSSSTPDMPPWSVSFADQGLGATLIAVDPSGAVALAGTFQDSIEIGGKRLSASGTFDDDIYIGMLDADGQPAWAGATGNEGRQFVTGITFTPDGDMLFAGAFEGSVDFGTGRLDALSTDTFLARIGRDGTAAWVKHFDADLGGPSGAGMATPYGGVAVDADGSIALAGTLTGTVGFGGPPLESESPSLSTSFVVKLDHDGKHVFSKAFGGSQNQLYGLAFDAAGNLVVAGANSNELDVGGAHFTSQLGSGFVAKLDPEGAPLWAFQLGGAGSSSAGPLAVDATGAAFVTGNFDGQLDVSDLHLPTTGMDGFVLKVDPDGTPVWLHDFPGATIFSIALDAAGKVLVAGWYQGAPDFGGGALPNLELGGAFLTTLDASGDHAGTAVFGVPDTSSTVTSVVVSGRDAIVSGTFSGPLDLGEHTLQGGAASSFVARIKR